MQSELSFDFNFLKPFLSCFFFVFFLPYFEVGVSACFLFVFSLGHCIQFGLTCACACACVRVIVMNHYLRTEYKQQ